MKATGIFRRIDELGRIVIPKEIRKNLKIREGDNIEIFVNDSEEVILRKYSSLKNIKDFAQRFTDSISSLLKENVFTTDKDHIISASGNLKKEVLEREISEELLSFIERRVPILENHKKKIQICENLELESTYIIEPIIVNGDAIGLFIILSQDNNVSDIEKTIGQIASGFFQKYLEE